MLVFVLAPQPPFGDWLGELDAWLTRSRGFFAGRPIVVDLSHQRPTQSEFQTLIGELGARDIRVIGVEGIDAAWLGPGLVPLTGTGQSLIGEAAGPPAPGASQTETPTVPETEVARRPKPASLVLQNPVRSGQSIVFPDGDVTVVGALASGAEIVAGGSIHIYGALRGRAIAGAAGDTGARIFCNRLDAELLAIAGLYKTAEQMGAQLRGASVQAWFERGGLFIGAIK